MKFLNTWLCAFALFSTFSLGEENAQRTVRLVFLEPDKDSPKSLYLHDGASIQKVELPSRNLSPVYRLNGETSKVTLYAAEVAAGEKAPDGAPFVEVPAGCSDFYLIISPDPKNPVSPVSLTLINASPKQLGKGEMLWLNQSDQQIVGTLAGKGFLLEAATQKKTAAPLKARGQYQVELSFRKGPGNPTLPISASQWRHDPRSRTLIVILQPENRKAPHIITFSDFRADPK